MKQELRVVTEHRDTTTILKLIGEVGAADCAALDTACTAVIERKPAVLVIDASRLAFISSVGMGCFVRLHRALKEHGSQIRIAGATPMVKGSLNRAKLEGLFQFHPTVDAAKFL